MGILRNIYAFFLNDWEEIKSHTAIWEMTTIFDRKYEEYAKYSIEYSKYLNRYRIKTSGLTPKLHSDYDKMVELVQTYKKKN
jgi:hypothetical protein